MGGGLFLTIHSHIQIVTTHQVWASEKAIIQRDQYEADDTMAAAVFAQHHVSNVKEGNVNQEIFKVENTLHLLKVKIEQVKAEHVVKHADLEAIFKIFTDGKPDADVKTLKSAWSDLQQQKAGLGAHFVSVGSQVLSKMSDLSSTTNMEALAQAKDGAKELKSYLTNVVVLKKCNATYAKFIANLPTGATRLCTQRHTGERRTRFCTTVFCADDHWCDYEGSPNNYCVT